VFHASVVVWQEIKRCRAVQSLRTLFVR
jgi:hypothetical protein